MQNMTIFLQSLKQFSKLTHWGWVMHICVCKLAIIGSDDGSSPKRCQAIIWTSAGILLIRTLGTNFSEILSEIHIFSFKKMHLKKSSAKWQPFCLGLNVLRVNDKMSHLVEFASLVGKVFSLLFDDFHPCLTCRRRLGIWESLQFQ